MKKENDRICRTFIIQIILSFLSLYLLKSIDSVYVLFKEISSFFSTTNTRYLPSTGDLTS